MFVDVDDRPIVLWAVPRSVSTAFERVFVERGDVEVLHEPFSMAYYYSAERCQDRYDDVPVSAKHNYDRVLERVLAPRDRPTFVKDMAYHVRPILDRDLVARFRNTFLIRDPAEAIASLHACEPEFTFEEAGFEQQHRLFTLAAEVAGVPPPAIDAADLVDDPEATLAAYCDAVGLADRPDALAWTRRDLSDWAVWERWHRRAAATTELREPTHCADDLPADLTAVEGRCRPFYATLHSTRLRPEPHDEG